MFDTKFRIKIVKHHDSNEDDKLIRRKELYDIYVNVGILPPIFNKWIIDRKGLSLLELQFYIRFNIFNNNKEIEIKY